MGYGYSDSDSDDDYVRIIVPENSYPGDLLRGTLGDETRVHTVIIPEGCYPGDEFRAKLPADVLYLHRVQAMGAKFVYNQCQLCRREGVVAFRREADDGDGHELVRVWWRTGTVGTYLKHPVQGKTQLFRRDINNFAVSSLLSLSLSLPLSLGIGLTSLSLSPSLSLSLGQLLGDIFNNPRRHTGRGYHRRR